MISDKYRRQVDLLLQVIPHIAKENVFGLKGGTAINLFVLDMPRVSVDIDLTYLPLDERKTALSNITGGLENIKRNIESSIKGVNVNDVRIDDGSKIKLNCQLGKAQIKIEVNSVTRGHLFPLTFKEVSQKVQDEFGKFAAIDLISNSELYGSKICAALDRQHPRDIFDIKCLFDNEGLEDEVFQGFILFLLSHNKPICELLSPVLKDQRNAFETQFSGMSLLDFSYKDYEKDRKLLINAINLLLSDIDKEFIWGFESGNPDWSKFKYPEIKFFPAVQWKQLNIQKLMSNDPLKHKRLVKELEGVLYN